MANFPKDSTALGAPRLLIQVWARGRGYRRRAPDGSTDIWAFEDVKPTLVLSDSSEGGTYLVPARFAKMGIPLT
jgi:hypothetical protein